ncbi:MAG: hypothetical protein ACR2OH_14630 [Microthrixaceae bacterium]
MEVNKGEGQAHHAEALAGELHSVVGTVRSREDLERLDMPVLDDLCGEIGSSRGELIARGIDGVQEQDYKLFLGIVLPMPFDGDETWDALGRKYIVEDSAGRGARAGHEAFGVTTWDALNVPLGELGGDSRREVAEQKLADSILTLGPDSSRRRSRMALVCTGVAAVLAAVVGVTVWSAASGGPGTRDVAERVAQEVATETTASLPESDLQGIQPGVEPTGSGSDLSADLEATLSEEELLFLHLRDVPIGPSPTYGLAFPELPARFHYQAFNPSLETNRCRGMMTRELEVVGVWERGASWPGGRLQVSVGRLAEPWMARELATALSLTVGIDPPRCRGMARFGVEDYEEYGVTNRDVHGLLGPGNDYNHWSQPGSHIEGRPWANSNRVILHRGPFMVDVAMVTDVEMTTGDAKVLGEVARQISDRL